VPSSGDGASSCVRAATGVRKRDSTSGTVRVRKRDSTSGTVRVRKRDGNNDIDDCGERDGGKYRHTLRKRPFKRCAIPSSHPSKRRLQR
jgi:hypothetical protein